MNKQLTIYVLKCEDECYYVGKTYNFEERMKQHESGEGSAWTKLHMPMEVVEQFEGDDFDEDKMTKKYMSFYGVDKVRGGSYVKVNLSPTETNFLTKELHGTNNVCFKCGRDSHFANQCYAKTTVDGKSLYKPRIKRAFNFRRRRF